MGLLEKALSIQKEEAENNILEQAKLVEDKIEDRLNSTFDSTYQQLLSQDNSKQFLLKELHSLSRPLYEGFAYQNHIDALLNLIEFAKEISSIENEEELWKTVMLTLLGHIGCKSLALFFKSNDDQFILKINKNFLMDDQVFISTDSKLISIISGNYNLQYTKDILDLLPTHERKWLKHINPILIVPILFLENLTGFILLGAPIGFEDYNLEDLIYLKTFGEILGSYYNPIKRIISIQKQLLLWQEREKKYIGFNQYFKLMEKVDSIDDINNYFINIVHQDYGVAKCIFLLRERNKFIPQIWIGLHENTIKKFISTTNESWILELNQINDVGWIEYTNFKANGKFIKNFSVEDLTLIENVFINTIKLKGTLEGLFLLFDVAHNLSSEDMRYLHIMVKSYFWGLITHKSNIHNIINLDNTIENPLHSIRLIITENENNLLKLSIPYSLISLQIINIQNLKRKYNENEAINIKNTIKNIISGYISEVDYLYEVLPGFFLLLLKGASINSCNKTIDNIKNACSLRFRDKPKRPLFKIRSLSRPEEKEITLDSFLFN